MARRPRRNGPFFTDSAVEAFVSWGVLAFFLGLSAYVFWS